MSHTSLRSAVRGVAVFEALKGVAALVGLLGLLSLLKHDLHHLVLEWIGRFGLLPHQQLPALLLNAVDEITTTPIHTLALLGSLYVAIRWIEAWGLWHDKAWGEWLGVISCGIYIPLEINHLRHSPHWQAGAILAINLLLISVLALRLYQRRRLPAALQRAKKGVLGH